LKRIGLNYLAIFSVFFVGNLILNAIFKPDLNIGTAFSVAFGVSSGMAIVEYYLTKKLKKRRRFN